MSPVVGEFHGKFWRARANPIAEAPFVPKWQYPLWQASRSTVTFAMAIWGVPFDAIGSWSQRLWRILRLLPCLWRWTRETDTLEAWITRITQLTEEEYSVLDRAIAAMAHPAWPQARAAVRRCATSPSFQDPEQWLHYGQAIKKNKGQAQNVYRHLKVVNELRGLQDAPGPLTNPMAHLLAELAYQGFAARDERLKEIVTRTVIH